VAGIETIKTDKKNEGGGNLSLPGFLKHIFRRTLKGIEAIRKYGKSLKRLDYIYSVSDFYPDFIPSLYAKLRQPRLKWIAGYYLFAPFPLSPESPYRGKNFLKGLFYWLMQGPSYFLVRRLADFVFVTSEPDVKKFITARRNSDKVVVIQGGVDLAEAEKYLKSAKIIPLEKRKYDACFVGRFHYQKGVLELVEIWKEVCQKKKNARLAMIGKGPLEEEVKAKIRRFHLEKNIDLLGFKDGKEKYEIFKQSKIIVHPATYDSGGMAAAEGMAWKLPGVSLDLEALKTYYPKGMIKTERGDLRAFADNVLKLLEDPLLYCQTAAAAHKLVKDVWDWRVRAQAIYHQVFGD
jgi:glycosyltransferase involved in cell wall biosynthesis